MAVCLKFDTRYWMMVWIRQCCDTYIAAFIKVVSFFLEFFRVGASNVSVFTMLYNIVHSPFLTTIHPYKETYERCLNNIVWLHFSVTRWMGKKRSFLWHNLHYIQKYLKIRTMKFFWKSNKLTMKYQRINVSFVQVWRKCCELFVINLLPFSFKLND